ncbi:MAG: Heme/hemopexin-binding protein [Candidatus Anoxychlamydiales bacterium]|nr:Heme/hemopexin-binding protein [Candidatus Anoxychlamydiales bacterium]
MPNASSVALNKVLGQDISSLMGTLNANGKIVLINSNGILIGNEAYISTASFIGSTFDVISQDILDNNECIFKGDSKASIENLGTITATSGDVFLIGYQLKNLGKVKAENGTIGIGIGKEILLKPKSQEKIFIKAQKADKDIETGIENNGEMTAAQIEIKADGNPYTLAIKNSKKIDALGTKTIDGKVFLVAENGRNENHGEIKAKNFDGTGGKVRLLGKEIGLTGSVDVSSSNEKNAGKVLFGGDYQGTNPDIINAKSIFMGEDAIINASANEIGNGGKVILWSDEVTQFFGTIHVNAGEFKGDGGFVEVSSKDYLNVQGMIYAKAPNGIKGNILFDPTNVFITNQPDNNIEKSAPPNIVYTVTPDTSAVSFIDYTVLNNLLNQPYDITISTTSKGPSDGNLRVNMPLNITNASLTLKADKEIIIGNIIDQKEFGTGLSLKAPTVTIISDSFESAIKNSSIFGNIQIEANVLNITAGGGVDDAYIGLSEEPLFLSPFDININITSTSGAKAYITSTKNFEIPAGNLTITSNGKDAYIESSLNIDLLVDHLNINNSSTGNAYVQSTNGNISVTSGTQNVNLSTQSASTGTSYIKTLGTNKTINLETDTFNLSSSNASSKSYIATNNGSINIITGGSNTSYLNSSTSHLGESYIAINETVNNPSNKLKISSGPLYLGPNSHIRSVNSGNIEIRTQGDLTLDAIAGSNTTDITVGATVGTIGTLTIDTTTHSINLNSTVGKAILTNNPGTALKGSIFNISGKNLTLTAGASDVEIFTNDDINLDLTGNFTLQASNTKLAHLISFGDIINFLHVKDINILGTSIISEIGAGRLTINSSGSLTMSRLSEISTASDINISMHGDLNLTAGSGSEEADIFTTGGNIIINNQGGSVNLTGGSNVNAFATIGGTSSGGNNLVSITTSNSLNLISSTGHTSIESQNGYIEVFAGNNITANANSRFLANSYINLVVDNNDPSFPNYGNGKFVFPQSGVTFTTGANQLVSLYSSFQSLNEVPNGTTINGNIFNKGEVDKDTPTEQWGEFGIYYPSIGTPPFGPGFIFYYKVNNNPGGNISHFLAYENEINEALSEMFYRLRRYTPIILSPLETPREKYIVNNEMYTFCYKNQMTDDEKAIEKMKMDEEKQKLMDKESQEDKHHIRNAFEYLFEKIKKFFSN